MAKYQELTSKLINAQLNKVKSAVKKKTELILRMNKKTLKMKNFYINCFWQQDEQLKAICQQMELLLLS